MPPCPSHSAACSAVSSLLLRFYLPANCIIASGFRDTVCASRLRRCETMGRRL